MIIYYCIHRIAEKYYRYVRLILAWLFIVKELL